jgi:hypothetical protein
VSSWSGEFEDVKMWAAPVHEAAVNGSIQHDGAVAHALKDWSDAYGVRGCGVHTHLYMRAVRSSHQDGGGAYFQGLGYAACVAEDAQACGELQKSRKWRIAPGASHGRREAKGVIVAVRLTLALSLFAQ